MKPTLESLERLMDALDLPLEALLEAQRFVRRIEESTRRGIWPGLPGPAWVRSDEVRESRARWPAKSVGDDFGAEELARLFRAWIREEIARTVGRT